MEKMTLKEAIAYLQPIADNTPLNGYHAALTVAIETMKDADHLREVTKMVEEVQSDG